MYIEVRVQELDGRIYHVCVQVLEAFFLVCAVDRKNSCVMSRVSPSWVWNWLLNCNAMTEVVLLQTVHKVLRREHVYFFVIRGGPPQSRILRCLYLPIARVTSVGAPDWCSIACDIFPQCVCRCCC